MTEENLKTNMLSMFKEIKSRLKLLYLQRIPDFFKDSSIISRYEKYFSESIADLVRNRNFQVSEIKSEFTEVSATYVLGAIPAP